LPVAFFQ